MKLCSKRRSGLKIECHHVGKSFANITMATSIGNEEQWAKQGLLDLSGAGLEAEFITTGPDSSAYRAAMNHPHIASQSPYPNFSLLIQFFF